MFVKSRIARTSAVLALVALFLFGGILLPKGVPAALAQSPTMSLTVSGPSYVTPGSNINYVLTVKNLTAQAITDIGVFSKLSANATYVSGGTFIPADSGVEFTIANLAANASRTLNLVVNVKNSVVVGGYVEITENQIFRPAPGAFGNGIRTTVEAPGTLVAVYKDVNGTPFDVTADGFQFENFTNEAPRVSSDDLGTADMFALFGKAACKSGTTAATCVLSGPARKWMEGQIAGMNGGHCEGMAVTSLRLFDWAEFKGKYSPADFQAGASTTIGLNFPQQSIENYIASYFIRQGLDEVWNATKRVAPVAAVQQLTTDFNLAKPIAYTVGIYRLEGPNNEFKDGHAITAYGVETVNAHESRILVYDNNYPKQRQYITVNMAANTWRYVTASTPGEPATVYAGTATTGNLELVKVSARDLPAGKYFICPFCPEETAGTGQVVTATGQISGTIRFEYAGEGAFLVANEADQSTGFAFDTEMFINEIPNATVNYFKGGLNKDVPPLIEVPFLAAPDAIYWVYISGKTIDAIADGGLTMTGDGYAMGLDNIQLDPDEFLEIAVSPKGNYIDFKATETITAPTIYLAYDPVNAEDPSVIFEVSNVVLDAGESVLLNMDRDKEQVFFDDTGAQGQAFDVVMTLIWPDGDEQEFVKAVDVPAGATSAFIDFGAWDGLLEPPLYISDILQNPSINHRLKLLGSTGRYDPMPRANAPAGVYRLETTFANVTEITLEDISFNVTNLAGGNLVLNADGGPGGLGATISILSAQLGGDGKLSPNESFSAVFEIGLKSKDTSDFTVAAEGVPHDWTFTQPSPAYDANNTVFNFQVSGSNSIYLPNLAR